MIPWKSHQTHSKTFLAVNPGLATICAGAPIFEQDCLCLTMSLVTHFSTISHHLQLEIRSIRLFFVRVAKLLSISNLNYPSKRFFMQFLPPGKSKQ